MTTSSGSWAKGEGKRVERPVGFLPPGKPHRQAAGSARRTRCLAIVSQTNFERENRTQTGTRRRQVRSADLRPGEPLRASVTYTDATDDAGPVQVVVPDTIGFFRTGP